MLNASHFPFLDGLRAISILWLVAFHATWFLAFFLPPETFFALASSGLAVLVTLSGHMGVDIFFVLSGFLITHVVLRSRAEGEPRLWSRFYRRRAFRILPVYIACLGLYVIAAGVLPYSANSHNLWANVLLINNYLSILKQGMSWTWSLAIEEQFYLVFPLLFLFARPLRLVLVLLVVALAARAIGVAASGPWHSIPIHPAFGLTEFVTYFDALYSPTHMRVGAILFGVLARMLLAEAKIAMWLHQRRARFALLVAASLAIAVNIFAPFFFKLGVLPSSALKPFLMIDRYLFSAGIAYLIVHALAVAPGGAFARVLSHRHWRPWAEVSYAAFLINPLTISAVGRVFAPSLQGLGAGPLALYAVACFALTFGGAFALFKWVETPFRKMGKREPAATARAAA